ncbi:Na+/H+ antiporter NhaA [Planotetraspora kaengkrachanensis]|uniref:Na(+)/H(+) antiporter NhaA n=1 Tax=Planotetraspora kaengkrachanensis TaxID=575193 RepID=A0A8J3PRA9_9ACTN|nr:Na+/H+ antiporter NhaA [Planotetraspora kaengkrachanensis]GIG78244.1 Na(+)/H(+) antiporter NhaA [Planotetraspora kaengkrachanensis]
MDRPAQGRPPRSALAYAQRMAEALRTETIGGVVVLVATAMALIWANSPWSPSYDALRNAVVGPMDLTLRQWSAEGLLAIFFFVAGLEIKEEFAHGELRTLKRAALPVLAAFSGMAVPALFYLAVSWGAPGAGRGWAIPMATDIAFALAVLAVTASAMPTALRVFLLTLAVVDDLGAITVIALFYSEKVHVLPLLGSAVVLAVYGFLQRRRFRNPAVYLALGLAAWSLMHESGVHATVAGVVCGLLTRTGSETDGSPSPARRAAHFARPLSAGLAVPVFAFLAAGVRLDPASLGSVFTDRIALGVVAGLVAGKFAGVFGGAWLSVRLGFARISDDLRRRDLAAVSVLAGIGFTVSLLIGERAYPGSDRVTTAVLAASLIAAALASALLHVRVQARTRHDVP